MIATPFHGILKTLGVHPTSFRIYLKWKKRGEFIAHLKNIAEQPKADHKKN
jgi:hypothetical protein